MNNLSQGIRYTQYVDLCFIFLRITLFFPENTKLLIMVIWNFVFTIFNTSIFDQTNYSAITP